MNWIGEIWRRVRMLARCGKFASELDEEMRLHREMKERELAERGVAADDPFRGKFAERLVEEAQRQRPALPI